ncbi:MAG: hypothetical protein U0900_14505 [Myxococcota bacterium]
MRSRPIPPLALLLVLGLAVGLPLALGLTSCKATPPDDPLRREPAVRIDGAALRRFLDRASTLAGTPAGRATARLRERLAGCEEVVLTASPSTPPTNAPAPIPSLDALACHDAHPLPKALAERLAQIRGDADGVLQWPVGERGRIALRFDVDARGGLALDGALEPDDESGALAFLVPAAEPPAPARIDPARTLGHLHLRSAAGTGLAALVPQGGQADRLFALKGRLLEGALLEGTLELAFVEPAPSGQVPLAVLALHHRAAAPIEAAVAETLARLDATWSIAPSPHRFGGTSGPALAGGCYADLPLLPELAPCWVVTPEVLLVGYRAEAIEAVLDATPAVSAPPTAAAASASSSDSDSTTTSTATSSPTALASGLVVDLERVRRLDHRLLAAQGQAPDAGPWPARLADLYARLELRAQAAPDGAVALQGRLEARP